MKALDGGTRLQKNERCGNTWLIISAERSRSGREGGRILRNKQWSPEKRQKKKTDFLLPAPGPSEKGPEKW